MQLTALYQPLDRCHLRSIGAAGLVDAGAHCLPIHDDRAGSTVALAAAVLGPREVQLVPQHLKQGGLRPDLDLMGGAIDVEGDRLFFH